MKEKRDTAKYILSQSWQFSYDRKMTYQKMRLFNYAYIDDIPKILHADFGPALHRMKDSINSEYLLASKFHPALLQIEAVLSDKKSIKTIISLKKRIVDEYKKAVPFVNKMPLSYKTWSNAKLSDYFEKYCSMEKTLSFATVLLFTRFEEPLTNTLTKLLTERLGDNERARDVLQIISSPTRMIPLDMYRKDLLNIILKPKKYHRELLARFTNKYISWGHYDVNYNEATLETHKEKYEELSAGDAKKALAEIQQKYALQKKETGLILKSMKKDAHLLHLIDLYVCYANYKDWKNFYREQSSYKLKILFREIGRRINLDESLVPFLLEEEIKDGLKMGLSVASKEISKRKKNSVFLALDGKFEIVTDGHILDDLDKVLETKDSLSIKGVGAYKGVARGRVKIIISNDDLYKLKAGDVLVTGTTRPDYIQAMVKAVAFVTNEGGLLSHAAIVSRELKKPCIIGTKIATKVLKDGDFVEVNADKGTVKILK